MIRFGWTSRDVEELTFEDMTKILYVLEVQAKVEELEQRKWRSTRN